MTTQPATTAPAKYVVHEGHTLCYRIEDTSLCVDGATMLGVLGSSIHGRSWRNSPFMAFRGEELREATRDDFDRFRVQVPADFGCEGQRKAVSERTRLYFEFQQADNAYQRELERAYGAREASDARYRYDHADADVQAAAANFQRVSEAWHSAGVAG